MNMVDAFGATSTTDEVLSGVNLQGKRVLVTGVSAGLGIETARSLAAHGADVVGAARDLKKAEAATTLVRREAETAGGSFELVALDLSERLTNRSSPTAVRKPRTFFSPSHSTGATAGLASAPRLCIRE